MGGLFGNLGGDLKDAIAGLPGGVVALARDPVGTAKAIGQAYAETYGPLLRGDLDEFARGLYEHPLGPLLDLAAVVSLGAGAAGRAGGALAKAGAIPEESRLARLGRPGEVRLRGPGALAGQEQLPLTRPTSRRPLRKGTQLAVDRALKLFPDDFPAVGELARFGRELRRRADQDAQRLRLRLRDHTKALARLSAKERAALHVLGRLPLTKYVEGWKRLLDESGEETAAEMRRLLDDPEIARLHERPTEAMLAALAEEDKLGRLSAEILGLSEEAAEQARFRHARLASGATAYSGSEARRAARQLDREVRRIGREQEKIEKTAGRLRARGTPELRQVRRQAGKTATVASRAATVRQRAAQAGEQAERLRGELAQAREQLERLSEGREITSGELLAAGLKPGSDLERVRWQLAGRKLNQVQRLAERYERALVRLHRLDETEIPTVEELATMQAGELAAYRQARQDIANRLQAGRAELDRLADIEEELLAARGELRPGIVGGPTVAELRAEIEAAGRPQPIYLPDTGAVTGKGTRGRGRTATAPPSSGLRRSQGTLFLLGHLALEPDALSPEFLRAVAYARYRDLHDALLESALRVERGRGKPADHVWVRRPVGVKGSAERIGYLESTRQDVRGSLAELVGDVDAPGEGAIAERGFTAKVESEALLDHGFRYAVPRRLAEQLEQEFKREHTAIRWFLEKPTSAWRALVLNLRPAWLVNNMVGNTLLYTLKFAGPAGLTAYVRAVRQTGNRSHAFRRLVEEHFPEQVAGTFLETQSKGTFAARQGGRKAVAVATAGLRPLDVGYEQLLRRAGVEAALRKAPQVKARLKAMPRETRSFEAAARQALDADPKLARQISDQVNDALGDFSNLTAFERQFLRRIVPFWAWYRAIALIMVKLPLDTPGRTDLLAKLGQIGADETEAALGEIPSYLKAVIPVGAVDGDRAMVFNTIPLNPLATVPQLSGDVSGTINPLAALAARALVGDSRFDRVPAAQAARAAGGGIGDIATGLPQIRLIETLTGRSYRGTPAKPTLYDRTRAGELLSYLGIPYRDLSLTRARQLARREERG